MIRGTTPTFEFALPFGVDLIAEAYITFAQGQKIILDKDLSACSCEDDKLVLKLTQEDTLKFISGRPVDIQIRVKTADGEALASDMIHVDVDRILKDGEI